MSVMTLKLKIKNCDFFNKGQVQTYIAWTTYFLFFSTGELKSHKRIEAARIRIITIFLIFFSIDPWSNGVN